MKKIGNFSTIIDKVTVCNAMSSFFGPPCIFERLEGSSSLVLYWSQKTEVG